MAATYAPKRQLQSSNMRARCRGRLSVILLNPQHRGIAMKNAHERFGKVVYVRRTEKASTNIRFIWTPLLARSAAKPILFRSLAVT